MKSNVSDQMEYMQAIYLDACMMCVADVSDLRDLGTLRSRLENEGESFLTITLPSFCSDFERSLKEGFIDSKYFRNFRKYRAIPAFLQGMLSRIFDVETGRIFNETPNNSGDVTDHACIVESVRQICLAFKKIQVPCSPEREAKAVDNFNEVERSLLGFSLQAEEHELFNRVSHVLWDNLVSRIRLSDCKPRHGPGATAERISGNQKFNWSRWHDRIEPFFPLVGNGFPLGLPSDSRELDAVSIIPQDSEQPVRVCLVPKTLKSPRIIAIEPCCNQFVQQGIRDALYRALESYRLTKGHVNFRDQSVNQKLAISASTTGQLATIDLSDASDRVPRDLALVMFQSNPDLRDAIDACRSTRAELPNGIVLDPLLKFASMGSALCFPVEAMYFYTICVIALLRERNFPISIRNVFDVSRSIYVYGDDIIVPSTNATAVFEYLQKYNCKVNTNKTSYTGKFRESCGVDAYDGHQVQPVYVRHRCPENRRDSKRIISWCKTGNLFYKKGYIRTAAFIFEQVERVTGPLPCVDDKSAGLGRTFPWVEDLSIKTRVNPHLQRREVRTLVPRPVYRTGRLEGYAALSKCLLQSGDGGMLQEIPFMEIDLDTFHVQDVDEQHLERYALHGAVTLQRRWVSS